MTVATTTRKVQFECDGSTYEFDFSFPIQEDEDLVVVVTDSSGVETTLTLTTDFEVSSDSGTYESGGMITTVSYATGSRVTKAWGSTYEITIYRSVPVLQETEFRVNRQLRQSSIETALDRIVMQIQDLNERIDRIVTVPVTDGSTSLELPNSASRASKYLSFDADGDPVASAAPAGTTAVSTFAATLLDDTTAAQARATLEIVDNTSAPDVYPETYGAVGDGVTDDSEDMQACFDAVAAMTYRPRIVFKAAKYHIHTGLTIPYAQGITLVGNTGGFYTPQAAGYTAKVTTLDYTGNGAALLIGDGSQNATGFIMEKFYVKGTSAGGAGVKFNTSAGWVLKDCTFGQFTGSGAAGLWVLKGQVSSLYNCSFIDNYYGSYLEGNASENTTLSFHDCVWHSNTNTGHREECGVMTRIINPTFQSNAGSAISIDCSSGPWVSNNFRLVGGYFSGNNESVAGIAIDIKGDVTSANTYHAGLRIADCYFGSPGAAQTAFIRLQYTTGAIIENPRFASVTDDILIADQTANPSLELLYWRAGETRIKDDVAGSQVLVSKDIDVNVGPIDFLGSAAANVAGAISTWTTGASLAGFVKVRINGADRWMPYYTAPSS